MDIPNLIAKQREHVLSGKTGDIGRRRVLLSRLKSQIIAREKDILDALYTDLHKSGFEGYMTEVGMVRDELSHALSHLGSWSRKRRVRTPLAQFPARSFIVAEPYGVVLIMSPWNYPFQLCLNPLVGAIAAGNSVVLKPSAYAPATSSIIATLIGETFEPEDVSVVLGGRAENEELLEQRFDHIFFTGSVQVGKLVMEKASRHLTPVTLELGGKSPAIVDASADITLAARRIAFGKFLNAGQTCVAPDYVLVEKSVETRFLDALEREIGTFFPGGDLTGFPSIINARHYDRLMGLLEDQDIRRGGIGDRETLQIVPTILQHVQPDAPVMQQEIFGPILPVLSYGTLDEAIALVRSRAKPLACYLFTTSIGTERRCLSEISFGGGCINDTVIHLATSRMPFGGVGESGMGAYHGKASFDTFTHFKSIVKKSNLIDLPFRYHPYGKRKERLVKYFLR